MTRKNVVFLQFCLLYIPNIMRHPQTAQVRPCTDSQTKSCRN